MNSHVNHEARAFKAWPVLTSVARRRELITYGELADAIGIHRRPIRYVLGVIQDYCLQERLPPLTILVVIKGSDAPSGGFFAWDTADLDQGRELVRGYNWNSIPNPFSYAKKGASEEGLANRLADNPGSSADVYALVKVRGIAQQIFRKALLKVYDYRCAFCELTFEEALSSAHIIEWNSASSAQRMSVKNGLLLCSTHHGLFDAGYLTLTHSYRIQCWDPKGIKGTYSSSDRQACIELHGRHAFLPENRNHWPSREALNHNHKKHGWGNLR